MRTRTRPTQREVVGGWLGGWGQPDLGGLSADARVGRWVFTAGALLLVLGAITAGALALRGTERSLAVVVPFEVHSSLLYAADAGELGFQQFDPESGFAPVVNLDAGSLLPLAQFVVAETGDSRAPVALVGTQQLAAEARANGAVQALGSATHPFDDASEPVVLDLQLSLIDAVFSALRLEVGDEVSPELVVTANGTVSGELAGVTFTTPLSQQLVFGLDGRELRLSGGSEPVVTVADEVSGVVGTPRLGSVPLLGDVRLSYLLVASIVIATLGLLLVDLVLVVSVRERGRGELRRARRRYGHLIVEASPVPLPEQVVAVPSMARLARAAQRMRRPILEVAGEGAVEFVVLAPGIAYCHRIGRPTAGLGLAARGNAPGG